MMIKCQKCGFENQMGSIFCRECGEKLDMEAIDPNKLQKDVDKEKSIKRAKKRIKSAISSGIAILIVVAFIFVVFPEIFPFGEMRQYEEPEVNEAVANQKYNAAVNGTTVGTAKYSYPEINRMLKTQVVTPYSELDTFAKVSAIQVAYDAEKNQPVVYMWMKLKDKVPVLYTIHGDLVFNGAGNDSSTSNEEPAGPLSIKVSRLDIGYLPLFASTNSFLNGFKPLLNHEAMQMFFGRAEGVEFTADGMNVVFKKGGGQPASFAPAVTSAPSSGSSATKSPQQKNQSASQAQSAPKAKSAAAIEKEEAAKRKAEEEAAKAEERKRKAEEYRQQQKEKEEERKRKLEEAKQKQKEEAEERKRKAEEEAQRRRDEAEERRREREERRNNNNSYNNGRNSRSSRSSRSNSSRNRY